VNNFTKDGCEQKAPKTGHLCFERFWNFHIFFNLKFPYELFQFFSRLFPVLPLARAGALFFGFVFAEDEVTQT
jgi:hypothetical protein